jgi:hypothetical protein
MVVVGGDNRFPRNGGNGWWHLAVLVMDKDETTGDMRSMDEALDFGEEVVRQRQRWLCSTVVGVGDWQLTAAFDCGEGLFVQKIEIYKYTNRDTM